jgi:hypothetical protein
VTPELRSAIAGNSDYDALPESIKATYSFTEWQWLSNEQKGRLMQTECEPEWSEPDPVWSFRIDHKGELNIVVP